MMLDENKIIKKYYPESEFLAQGSNKLVHKLGDNYVIKVIKRIQRSSHHPGVNQQLSVIKYLNELGLYAPIDEIIKVNSEVYLLKEKFLEILDTPIPPGGLRAKLNKDPNYDIIFKLREWIEYYVTTGKKADEYIENITKIQRWVKLAKQNHNIEFLAYPGSPPITIRFPPAFHGWTHIEFGKTKTDKVYILDIDLDWIFFNPKKYDLGELLIEVLQKQK